MKYDVFISYRRDGAEALGQLLYTRLRADGYTVFFDVEAMRSGLFNTQIYDRIDECDDVLVLLPPNGLDRCAQEGDWVRLEIAHAIRQNKNIVPVMMRNFIWPLKLPDDMESLRHYHGIEADMAYFDAVYNKLRGLITALPAKTREQTGVNLYQDIQQHMKKIFERSETSWIDQKSKTADKPADEPGASTVNTLKKKSHLPVPACQWQQCPCTEERSLQVAGKAENQSIAFELCPHILEDVGLRVFYLRKVAYQDSVTEAGSTREFRVSIPALFNARLYGREDLGDVEIVLLSRTEKEWMINTLVMRKDVFFVSETPTKLERTDAGQKDILAILGRYGALNMEPEPVETDAVQSVQYTAAFDPSLLAISIIDSETLDTIVPSLAKNAQGERVVRFSVDTCHEYLTLTVKPQTPETAARTFGIAYLHGLDGVSRNLRKAANAFHVGCMANPADIECCYELGCLFLYSEELYDLEDARLYLKTAADKGHAGARYQLAKLALACDAAETERGWAIDTLRELLSLGYRQCGDEHIEDLLSGTSATMR